MSRPKEIALRFTQTPLCITKEIKRYARKISPHESPLFVAIDKNTPRTRYLNCFGNVADRVAELGGQPLLGWAITVFPRVLIEFQLHAVWQRPTPGKGLLDITPQDHPDNPSAHPETEILFLPDRTIEPPKKRKPNRMFALSEDPATQEYVKLSLALVEEAHSLFRQRAKMQSIRSDIALTLGDMAWQPQPKDPCICGSRKRNGSCHNLRSKPQIKER